MRKRSAKKLAELNFEAACFGHGEPVRTNASAALRTATDPFG